MRPLLFLLLALEAGAQTAANWTQKSPAVMPPARASQAMAYDSARAQVVMFGGERPAAGDLTDTWVWDGANWSQKSPQTSPAARTLAAMAYDSAHAQVLLFGGAGRTNNLNETWVWDGSNWTQKFPQTSPPARSAHAMAFDAAHGQVVLFGGHANREFDDTWVWDGVNWIQKFPQDSPSARDAHTMTYDSARGQVVLFGGSGNRQFNETWVWDGVNWIQKSPQTSPPPRSSHAMAFDSARSQIVLFSGDTGSTSNDTWVWDGVNWSQQLPPTSPSARISHTMAYDSSHSQIVLFGGLDLHTFATLADTWIWGVSGAAPTLSVSPSNLTFSYTTGTAAPQGQPLQIALTGGTAQFSASASTASGGAWLQVSPASGNAPGVVTVSVTPQSLSAGTYTGTVTVSSPAASAPVAALVTLKVALPTAALPAISSAITASGFGGSSAVAPGTWVEIYGSNLSSTTRPWAGGDFTGNNAPTMLDGVQAMIAGQKAFVDYVSPGQVNAQLPSNIGPGQLQLTVTNANGTSAPFIITVNTAQPGFLAPAAFNIGGKQYVVAQLADGNFVLPVGAIPGVNSRPAKPTETIVIYGIGFGSVVPSILAGQIVTQTNQLSAPLQILFAGSQAQAAYAGLSPGYVGLYQFNVVVPNVADNNLVAFTFNLGGAAGMQTLYTAVHQ